MVSLKGSLTVAQKLSSFYYAAEFGGSLPRRWITNDSSISLFSVCFDLKISFRAFFLIRNVRSPDFGLWKMIGRLLFACFGCWNLYFMLSGLVKFSVLGLTFMSQDVRPKSFTLNWEDILGDPSKDQFLFTIQQGLRFFKRLKITWSLFPVSPICERGGNGILSASMGRSSTTADRTFTYPLLSNRNPALSSRTTLLSQLGMWSLFSTRCCL